VQDSEKETISQFTDRRNAEKKLFTAGPASLVAENLYGLMPCFGRGDSQYDEVEERVLAHLRKLTGHGHLARLQGSGSTALEVMITNFSYGKVLVIDTGYYSDRAAKMAEVASACYGEITTVEKINWKLIDNVSESYDWVIGCYTETSIGLKQDITKLKRMCSKIGAKLMLDATASVGLEDGHELADAISFSSCKGLFGLTGAGFIAFHERPNFCPSSFSLSLNNHLNKMMTGPYHAICSLDYVLEKHSDFRYAVEASKEKFIRDYEDRLVFDPADQPKLCTQVSGRVVSQDPKAILYTPRSLAEGFGVICHLGEVHLGREAVGAINDVVEVQFEISDKK
jgi:2-aminoethylphosphonate-pyruvate transaminase